MKTKYILMIAGALLLFWWYKKRQTATAQTTGPGTPGSNLAIGQTLSPNMNGGNISPTVVVNGNVGSAYEVPTGSPGVLVTNGGFQSFNGNGNIGG